MKCPFSFVLQAPGGHIVYKKTEYGHQVLKGVIVPCGKCIICRKNKAHEWATRLQHELLYHKESCFITLTYNPDTVPVKNGLLSLQKSDYQKFMKRFRKNIGKKVKYYAVGEYGSKTERPHYHAIIFGWQPKIEELISIGKGLYTNKELESIWKQGNVSVGSVTESSIHYVTGYMLKKLPKTKIMDREKEYLLCSQGLGLQYAQDHKEEIYVGMLKSLGPTNTTRGAAPAGEARASSTSTEAVFGGSTAIPKYYLKKLPHDKSVRKRRLIDIECNERRKIGGQNIFDIREKAQKARKQKHRECLALESRNIRMSGEKNI